MKTIMINEYIIRHTYRMRDKKEEMKDRMERGREEEKEEGKKKKERKENRRKKERWWIPQEKGKLSVETILK